MDTKIFHGNFNVDDIANALVARFNTASLIAQKTKNNSQTIIQISTRQRPKSGGQTALGVTLIQDQDAVTVKLGEQAWLGIAASLGTSALATLMNPWNIVGRLDDIAQDIQNLELDEQVWQVIEEVAHAKGVSHELSERLRRLTCEYCRVANPVGEANCLACGAPLGDAQPFTCKHCGFLATTADSRCPNCNQAL